jgi:hypothetical protein
MKRFVSSFVLLLISCAFSIATAQTLTSTALFQCDGCTYAWFPDGSKFVVFTLGDTGIGSIELRDRAGVRQPLPVEDNTLSWLGTNRVYIGTDQAVYTVTTSNRFRRLALPATYRGARTANDLTYGADIRPIVSPDGKWILTTSVSTNRLGLLSSDFSKFQDFGSVLGFVGRSVLYDSTAWETNGVVLWWQDKLYVLMRGFPNASAQTAKHSESRLLEVTPGSSLRSIAAWRGDFLIGLMTPGKLVSHIYGESNDQVYQCAIQASSVFDETSGGSCALAWKTQYELQDARISANGAYIAALTNPDWLINDPRSKELESTHGGTPLVAKSDGSIIKRWPSVAGGRFYGPILWSPTNSEFLVEFWKFETQPNTFTKTLYHIFIR